MISERRVKALALVLIVAITAGCLVAWVHAQKAAMARIQATARINAQPHPAETTTTTVALFVGDTFATGTSKVYSANTFPCLTAALLDWECRVDAAADTGFVASSTVNGRVRAAYTYRLRADTQLFRPDIVVVTGGGSDQGDARVESAALAYFRSVRKAFPKAVVVDVLPFWINEHPPKTIVETRQAVRRAAGKADVEVIDPSGWLWDGVSVDGVHPDGDGHKAIATKLAPLLNRAMGH